MNEALMTALAETVIAAEEALDAAKDGRVDEARRLLVIVDEGMESGQGGNAAHAARRKKILRLESETRALLKAAGFDDAMVPDAAPTEVPAEPEVTPAAPVTDAAPEAQDAPEPATELEQPTAEEAAPEEMPLPAAELPVAAPESEEAPAALAAAPEAAPAPAQADAAPVAAKAPRNVAPPKHLTAEAWNRVGTALRLQGMDAAERAAALPDLQVALNEAKIARDTHRTKVAEAALLQARVDVAALEGDVDAANAAWDRLFDVTTGLRGAAQKLQRAGTPDAAKDAAYEQARQFNLRVSGWSRGVNAA